jgi:sortase (surface protein transpeptidase)
MGIRMNDPDDLEIALNKGWKNEHSLVICTDEMTSKSKSIYYCVYFKNCTRFHETRESELEAIIYAHTYFVNCMSIPFH